MDCKFCKKTFSSKSNLSSHQKTAKYCLDLQGKENENFECIHCLKKFTLSKTLNDHIIVCKDKQKKEKELIERKLEKYKEIEKHLEDCNKLLKEKSEYIAKLEEKIEKLEFKVESFTTIALTEKTTNNNTTTTTNNITVMTSNVLNLSQEHIKKILTENLDYNVVYAGQAGLAKFVVDNMLTDDTGKIIYKCVDPSRQMFEFMNEKGEIIRDMKAEKLIQSLINGDVIKIGLNEAAKGWNTEDKNLNLERSAVFAPKVSEYADLNRNNTVFRSKVSSLTV